MRRLVIALAALILLRADMYPDASNAKLPEAQHNLGQMQSIVPQQYGAVGDGAIDDTAAVQAWLNDLKTGSYVGYCRGKFRLTASVNAFPANSYRLDGAGPGYPGGCQFYVDYNGWGSAAFDLSNPAGPTNANRGGSAWLSNIGIGYNPALIAPPIGLRHRYSSGLFLTNVTILQYTVNWGTCLSISSAWNVRLRDVEIWGCGGNVGAHLRTSQTFSIASAATTLTSSALFFSAADVGLDIALGGSMPREVFRITGYTDPQTVTVGRPAALSYSGATGALSSITGAMTAASPALTVSHPSLSAADVGRTAYVLGAGTTTGTAVGALRSTVSAVSGTTVTLANAAGTTAAAGSSVIFDPAVEVYTDVGGTAAYTNDIRINGLHAEQFAGTGLLMLDGVNVRGDQFKLHGFNNTATLGQSNKESQFNAVLVNTDAQFGQMEIEGSAITTLGQILIQGITAGGNTLQMLGGIVFTGQPKVAVSKLSANSGVTIGTINSVGQVAQALNVVTSDGTGFGIVGLGAVTAQLTNAQLPKLIGTLPKATVAALPVCWAPYEGWVYAVSDANSAVFNAVVAAGGANKVIAYCDGAAWKVH